jgi:hypothetical protein
MTSQEEGRMSCTGKTSKKENRCARQQSGKHFFTAMNQYAIIEELLEAVFSMWSVPMLYNNDHQQFPFFLVKKLWSWVSRDLMPR